MSGVSLGIAVGGAWLGEVQARKARDAADRAARGQGDAAGRSEAEMRRQFELNQKNFAPWIKQGELARTEGNALMGLGGDTAGAMQRLQSSPGYTSRFALGRDTMEAGSSARGGMGSGKAMVAAQRYGQDYASNEMGNRLNQLNNISDKGYQASATSANMGTEFGNKLSDLWTNDANVQGASSMAGFNAESGARFGGIGLGFAGVNAYQAYLRNKRKDGPPQPQPQP